MRVWQVRYTVLQPVDNHPTGPRLRVVRATDRENAEVMVAMAYDRRPLPEWFHFRDIAEIPQ